MRALGLTCGIGSMLVGAKQAGFDIVGNIEWRKYYHSGTFEYNFPGAFMVNKVSDLTEEQIALSTGVDIAFSHPECGNFSQLRTGIKSPKMSFHQAHENKGDIPVFLELVNKFKPKFFVMDNLPRSLIAVNMEEYAKSLPEYDLFPEWVSNYHYGNIQKNRKRLFLIGALKEEKFVFVPGEADHDLTVKSIIGDLQEIGNLPNHHEHTLDGKTGKGRGMDNLDRHMDWSEFQNHLRTKPDGYTMKYIKEDGSIGTHMGLQKIYWEKYCTVLHGGFGAIHPKRNLPLTIRERARIQGFPDDFVFVGEVLQDDGKWSHMKNGRLVKQTGKAMPIQFNRFIAEQISAHIEGVSFETTGERLIKPNEYIDKAKYWYCKNIGYSNQESACKACWLNCLEKEEILCTKSEPISA